MIGADRNAACQILNSNFLHEMLAHIGNSLAQFPGEPVFLCGFGTGYRPGSCQSGREGKKIRHKISQQILGNPLIGRKGFQQHPEFMKEYISLSVR